MNPLTGKDYSEESKKERLKVALMPAADPLVLEKLDKLFAENNTVIVKAETGAGKGVVIAPHILELVFNSDTKVYVTQPRTVNTHVAEYLKIVLDAPDIVNYGYRFANNLTKNTRLHFVTDGFLLNVLYGDNLSPKDIVVIIDEVHERNKNIDQLLLYCKNTNIKTVLMSATVDVDFFKKYFIRG
jgi:HrpA-like RNA helicase